MIGFKFQERGPTKLGGGVGAKQDIAQVAKLVRAELASAFPSQKFCVSVDRYSMGESINVSWVDGPSSVRVDAIANKYQDIDYDPYAQEILSGGNRYVQTHRRYTPSLRAAVTQEFREGGGGRQAGGFLTEWHKLSSTDYPQAPFKCVRGHARAAGGLD